MKTSNPSSDRPSAIGCDIVRDLLPLYHDGVISEAGRRAVSEHLDSCRGCAEEYKLICAELPAAAQDPDDGKKTLKSFNKLLKKLRRKSIVAGTVLGAAAIFGIGYLLTTPPLKKIDPDNVDIYSVCAYDYGGEDGKGIFIEYSRPYKYFSGQQSCTTKLLDGGVLEITMRSAVIGYGTGDRSFEDFLLIPAEDDDDIQKVLLNGKEIWNDDSTAAPPDYVEAYWQMGHTDKIVSASCSGGNHTFYYTDGSFKTWDRSGNIIAEGNSRSSELSSNQ